MDSMATEIAENAGGDRPSPGKRKQGRPSMGLGEYVGFKVPREIAGLVRSEAQQRNVNSSQILREALAHYFAGKIAEEREAA
jgi:hypothetical protein